MTRTGWKERWEPADNGGYGPKHWYRLDHSSGYSIGEVDAGRYMAAEPDGNGLIDETGDYCAWSSVEDAKAYIESILSKQ